VACTRIARGKGVCGTAWAENRTLVVPDVDLFPGHIACSPHSRSEIVVPCHDRQGRVAAVLDIDSAEPDDFSQVDATALQRFCAQLAHLWA
jgi:GAF domain-containing protein